MSFIKYRDFPIRKFGSSVIVILDRQVQNMLGITKEEIEKRTVGISAENIKKIRFDLVYKSIKEIEEIKKNAE